ncbi:toprim domain-containing protein [Lewinella sp. LCG006]|uniref:toprim domain-containing protein n=1 Tax=Lewinella sp. LCG006 TaxID=3231911 RepID=UPI00345F3CF8
MNANQAKKIDLPDLLSRLGFNPIKMSKGGREVWYRSPFRNENTASFHTSFLGGKWIWKDFGDEGGNVIDFVMRYQDVDFKAALAFLRDMYQGSLFETKTKTAAKRPFPFQPEDTLDPVERDLEFIEAYPIKRQVIFEYLESVRGIPAEIAQRYLQEVSYKNKRNGKIFFAIGMQNESEGYEIRSASDRYKFKSALIHRDLSLILGRAGDGGSATVHIFEGMTDFLSLLVLKSTEQLDEDAIIMHSVSTYNKTLQTIRRRGYSTILTYFDNDKTGRDYTEKLQTDLPTFEVRPQNQTFLQHKDLNEELVARRQSSLPGLSL